MKFKFFSNFTIFFLIEKSMKKFNFFLIKNSSKFYLFN